MENILETTRRQNAASSLIPKTKLAGLDRHSASRPQENDLPEIVIVSVPDLGHAAVAAPHAAALTSQREYAGRERAAASGDTAVAVGASGDEITEFQRSPLAGPHSAVTRSADEADYDSAYDTAFDSGDWSDSQVDETSLDEPSDPSATAAIVQQASADSNSVADRLFADIGELEHQVCEADQFDQLDQLDLSTTPVDDEANTSDDEAYADTLRYAGSAATAGSLAPRRVLPQFHAQTELTDEVSESTQEQVDEATATLISDTSSKEMNSRMIEARERHGRTIARSLFDLPAIADATTLLLVATGGVRRALDPVECLGRGIAWHRDREVRLTSIESHPDSIWQDLPEVPSDTNAESEWGSRARVLRQAADRRLSTTELAIEVDDSRRLDAHDLRNAVRRDRQENCCSLWLIDGSETDLCEALAAACDATLMLVDLHSSRVASSRWVVTHLREHGARIVGTIVVNAFEEEA